MQSGNANCFLILALVLRREAASGEADFLETRRVGIAHQQWTFGSGLSGSLWYVRCKHGVHGPAVSGDAGKTFYTHPNLK